MNDGILKNNTQVKIGSLYLIKGTRSQVKVTGFKDDVVHYVYTNNIEAWKCYIPLKEFTKRFELLVDKVITEETNKFIKD